MTPQEVAIEFRNNTAKMTAYNQALSLLRESGFENVLRRLGEPVDVALEHTNHVAISAFAQAEKRGWYQALDLIFNFEALVSDKDFKDEALDFGAREMLQKYGYTQKEIDEAGD